MNVLNWIKANPLTVACAAVIVVALVSFYFPTHRSGAALRADMEARQPMFSQLDNLGRTQVALPPSRPDARPGEVQMVANEAAIRALEEIYRSLEREYIEIYAAATEYNRRGHGVLLDDLFPAPSDMAQQYEARDFYTAAFGQLYRQLNAGGPPSAEQVAMIMRHEEDAVRRANHLDRGVALTERMQREMERRQAESLVRLYRSHASRLHVYATPTRLNDRQGVWQPGIFHVGSWARQGPMPDMFDIWEGQLGLWIQQDLVTAIRQANRMNDPTVSLLELPIKRVRSISIEPGYIGRAGGYFSELRGSGAGQAQAQPAGGASAAYEARVREIQQMLDSRIPDNFTVSPTGRATNPIYDVRHARLSLLVDSEQIPAVLDAIESVNFMTVIGAEVSNVNEYEALREGYYYGPVDVVRLDLNIETIWLRSWTAGHLNEAEAEELGEPFNPGLMPDSVRAHLGLPPRDESFDHSTQRTGPQRDTGPSTGPSAPGGPPAGGAPGGYGEMMQQQMQQMQQQQMQQRGGPAGR